MLTAGELGSFLLLALQSEEGVQGRAEASCWCPDHVARVTMDIPCLSLGSGPAWGSKNWPGWGGGHRHAQTLPLLTCPVPYFCFPLVAALPDFTGSHVLPASQDLRLLILGCQAFVSYLRRKRQCF